MHKWRFLFEHIIESFCNKGKHTTSERPHRNELSSDRLTLLSDHLIVSNLIVKKQPDACRHRYLDIHLTPLMATSPNYSPALDWTVDVIDLSYLTGDADTSRGSVSVCPGSINHCFSSTIIRVEAWISLSCMIINHFIAGRPHGEITLFETERSLVWSPWQPKRATKNMCPLEVSLSRTLNLNPFISSHFSLGKSSHCKCQLNARTWRFKWIAGTSLCIRATVFFSCMTIKHFLVDSKDESFSFSWEKEKKRNEAEERWTVGWSIMIWGQWDPRRWMERLLYCSAAC